MKRNVKLNKANIAGLKKLRRMYEDALMGIFKTNFCPLCMANNGCEKCANTILDRECDIFSDRVSISQEIQLGRLNKINRPAVRARIRQINRWLASQGKK